MRVATAAAAAAAAAAAVCHPEMGPGKASHLAGLAGMPEGAGSGHHCSPINVAAVGPGGHSHGLTRRRPRGGHSGTSVMCFGALAGSTPGGLWGGLGNTANGVKMATTGHPSWTGHDPSPEEQQVISRTRHGTGGGHCVGRSPCTGALPGPLSMTPATSPGPDQGGGPQRAPAATMLCGTPAMRARTRMARTMVAPWVRRHPLSDGTCPLVRRRRSGSRLWPGGTCEPRPKPCCPRPCKRGPWPCWGGWQTGAMSTGDQTPWS